MENLEVALITKKDEKGINYCNKFGYKIMQDILNYNPGSDHLCELPFLVGLQPAEKSERVLEIEEKVLSKKIFLIHSSRAKNDEYVENNFEK